MHAPLTDFGFDPLNLGSDPQLLKWFVQAELVHGRTAMMGAAGILFTSVRVPYHDLTAVKHPSADPPLYWR